MANSSDPPRYAKFSAVQRHGTIIQAETVMIGDSGARLAQSSEARPEVPGSPATQPPCELELLVRTRSREAGKVLVFDLFRRGVRFGRTFESAAIQVEPKALAGEILTILERGGSREVAALGSDLARQLLPAPLAEELWREANSGTGKGLLIHAQSRESWVPWEVLRPGLSRAGRYESGPHLGHSFAVAHAPTGPLLRQQSSISKIALVRSKGAGLPAMEAEFAGLRSRAAEDLRVDFVPAHPDDIERAFREGDYGLWHVCGHGIAGRIDAQGARYWLDEAQVWSPRSLASLDGDLAETRPLIFFNACYAGHTGPALTELGGWAPGFLDRGASAFLGPAWEVRDSFAAAFSQAFYDLLFAGVPLGEAVRLARREKRNEGDPASLAYVLFGHPDSVYWP